MSKNTAGYVLDEFVDSRLTAMQRTYGLMVAAKRQPETWTAISVPAEHAESCAERVRHEEFEVRVSRSTLTDSTKALSIRWMGGHKNYSEVKR